MSRFGKHFYTLLEFGTDKICVMYATQDEYGRPAVLSFVQKSSASCISKGTILDYNATLKILKQALNEADRGKHMPEDRGEVYYLLNGYPQYSKQVEGTVFMGESGKKITVEHVEKAIDLAKSIPEPDDRVLIGDYDSYFVIDHANRCKDPVGQLAERLDAFMHLVYTERKRVDRINAMLQELGFEQGGEPFPAGIMSVFSALTEDERNHGSVLIDMGAGVTTYAVIAWDGVLLSGVIPIGRDNVVNDLAIGLDIPYEFAQTFLRESKLRKLRETGVNILEYMERTPAKKRNIPLDSFEKIIQLRLREIFSFIKNEIDKKQLINYVGTGCVLVGGGAMIDGAPEILQDIMGIHARVGEPAEIPGTENLFRSAPCCYTALVGMLKFVQSSDSGENSASGLGDALVGMFDSFMNHWEKTKGALKL